MVLIVVVCTFATSTASFNYYWLRAVRDTLILLPFCNYRSYL